MRAPAHCCHKQPAERTSQGLQGAAVLLQALVGWAAKPKLVIIESFSEGQQWKQCRNTDVPFYLEALRDHAHGVEST